MSDKKTQQSYPPHWCKYCYYYGEYNGFNACFNIRLLRLLLTGPKIVKFDETCERFKYAKEYKNQKTR